MSFLESRSDNPGSQDVKFAESYNSYEELHSINLPKLEATELAKTITVRVANNSGCRDAAETLINRMYSWRGYGADHRLLDSPARTTFTAYDKTEVVGTVTLNVDSREGLAADQSFSEEINIFRSVPGARVCELTKLAFDAAVPCKSLLASFFHIVFLYGKHHYDCTDLFIEVNPRHRRFYEAMLGFRRLGELKQNQAVGAPAQLMALKVSDIRAQIDRHAQRVADTDTRSLYPLFFSEREEADIYDRLAFDYPGRCGLLLARIG